MRKSFVDSCEKMINQGENSVVILGDIGVYGFQKISNEFPSRVLNLGIMEQAMVGVGSGFASRGIIPTLHSIAPFLIERALEQIKIDFGYQNYPANFVSVGASFDYATLGCTHHCPADIPNLANIPGVDLFIPGHAGEFSKLFDSNWNSNSINYFRLTENVNLGCHVTVKGQTKRLKLGKKAIIIAVGPILDQVISGLAELDVEIHYVNSIPAKENLEIITELRNVPLIIFEPYYPGTVLAKILSQVKELNLIPMQFGVKKIFSKDYGSYENHLKFHELDSDSISTKVRKLI
jgi:transketolase